MIEPRSKSTKFNRKIRARENIKKLIAHKMENNSYKLYSRNIRTDSNLSEGSSTDENKNIWDSESDKYEEKANKDLTKLLSNSKYKEKMNNKEVKF